MRLSLGFFCAFFLVFPLFSLEVFRPNLASLDEEPIFFLEKNEPFQIVLEGTTWVYQGKSEGVEFGTEAILSREIRFNFIPNSGLVSRIPLKFFRQDTSSGELSLLTVYIEPTFSVAESPTENPIQSKQAPQSAREGRETLINWADRDSWTNLSNDALQTGAKRLAHWGDFQGALELTKERAKRGEAVAQLLGDYYYQLGQNKEAYASYQKALKESPDEEVLLVTIFLAMLEKDTEKVTDSLRYWVTTFDPPEEKFYLMIFHYLIEQDQWDSAMRWANSYPNFYKSPQFRDRYNFLMGGLWEGDSPYRNLRMALAFYDRLLKDHPLSVYWKTAYDRSLALKGFYFSE